MISPQGDSANWRRTRSRIATAARYSPRADRTELLRQMRAERLAEYVARVVDDAPPLSAAQRDAIALVLRGATLTDARVVNGLAA